MEHDRKGNELTIRLDGRITAENAPQIEAGIFAILQDGMPEKVVLDAKDLTYISSNGLRILMKLRKACPALSIIHVSRDVEDILRMTGMDKMMDVRRALREISVEGCPCIGKGKNGAVYRLDQDTIVKLYSADRLGWQAVEEEKRNAREALILGVPTALSYDVVRVGRRENGPSCDAQASPFRGAPAGTSASMRVGDGLGIIFELVDAKSLRDVVATEPGQLESKITKAAELLRHLHSIHVPAGTFPQMEEVYRARIANLADLLAPEEIDLLYQMIDSIPARDTYVHGDFHRGNLMVQGDEIIIIDMADSAIGHPLYDVLGVYMLGKELADTLPPEQVKQIIGWDADTVRRVWAVFSRVYFGTQDSGELAQIEAMLKAYGRLRHFTFLKIVPVFTEEYRRKMVQSAREAFFPKVKEHIANFAERIAGM